MYTLILTHEERKAIDWIGNRYATGYEFKERLQSPFWDMIYDIIFHIPEHIAWEICDLFETEDMTFPCFAPEFVEKLMKFHESVI